jgi:hypothetical protein
VFRSNQLEWRDTQEGGIAFWKSNIWTAINTAITRELSSFSFFASSLLVVIGRRVSIDSGCHTASDTDCDTFKRISLEKTFLFCQRWWWRFADIALITTQDASVSLDPIAIVHTGHLGGTSSMSPGGTPLKDGMLRRI